MNKTNYILYARKSTESEDRQVQSIDDQIKLMTELAKRQGFNIVKILKESRSAKTPHQRPEFTKMIALIEDRKANGIICWQLNRLSRNPTESGLLQQLLQDEKLLAIQTNDRLYLPDDNAIVFSVDAGMSNQFIRDLMKNVRRGMHSKAEKGWLPGVPPIGYKNDRENRTIVKDLDRFDVVRSMWDLILTGTHSVKAIADKAEHEWGLRTMKRKRSGNRPMSYSSVYDMFHNPFYKGTLVYAGKEYPGKHEPMVTEEEFEKVQKLIHSKPVERPKNKDILCTFRGLLRCGECGCSITPQHNIKRQKNGVVREYDYYRCSLRRKDYKCSQTKYVRDCELEKQFSETIKKYTIMPNFYDLAVQALQELDSQEIGKQMMINDTRAKSITAKENEIRELGRMRYRGECPDDDFYNSEKLKLEQELIDLRKARDKEETKARNWRTVADETFNFARYAEERFNSDSIDEKRNVLVKLGQNLQLKEGKLEFTPSKYLVYVGKKHAEIAKRYEEVRTLPEQMKKAAEAAIISDWYSVVKQVRDLILSDFNTEIVSI